MTALSYLYVVLGAAFIVVAALVVKIGAGADGALLPVKEVHERPPVASSDAAANPEGASRTHLGRGPSSLTRRPNRP